MRWLIQGSAPRWFSSWKCPGPHPGYHHAMSRMALSENGGFYSPVFKFDFWGQPRGRQLTGNFTWRSILCTCPMLHRGIGPTMDDFMTSLRSLHFLCHGELYAMLVGVTLGPFTNMVQLLSQHSVSNHINYQVWVKINYPFPNFGGCTIKCWEWINNLVPSFIVHVIDYPCWG